MGAAVSISDAFILGSIRDSHIKRHLSGISSRFIAAMLLMFCWPALLITGLLLKLFRYGPVVFRREVVGLPIATSEWRTFQLTSFINAESEAAGLKRLFLIFLPALINVARGDLRFVGVAARTTAQVKAMPVDWKALYLHSKAGIVTEAFVNYGTSPTDDELYTAEAFYATAAGLKHDLRLMRKYLVRVLRESSSSGRRKLRLDGPVMPARVK
jgi:lipopolysaccharide/colanic/teichoic acid biosynthesis glycosyltransferase